MIGINRTKAKIEYFIERDGLVGFSKLINVSTINIKNYLNGIPDCISLKNIEYIKSLFETSLDAKMKIAVKELREKTEYEMLEKYLNKQQVKNYDNEDLEDSKTPHHQTGAQMRRRYR